MNRVIQNRLIILISLIFTLLATPLDANTERPKIGLVLGGGGARGFAHVGVIKVLEELRIPVDIVVGTSMGSIAGGLYAAGLTTQELETAITNIHWTEVFRDAPNREHLPFRQKQQDFSFMVKSAPGFKDGELVFPQGLIEGQKLNFILKSLTLPVAQINNFDELPIPYRAIATDIENGDMVVVGTGDLANAMRASMSVPGVFSPIRMDGKLLVDGGMVNNVPIDIARAMGADIVIAVDVGTPLLSGDKIKSVLDIAEQLTGLMVHFNVKKQLSTLKPQDIFIQPQLGDLGSADFERSAEGIVLGKQAADAVKEKLQTLSLSQTEYEAHLLKRQKRRIYKPVTVEFIKIINNARLSDEVIQSKIRAKIGQEIDLATLQEDFSEIYGLDIFERVDYTVVTEKGKTGLLVESAKKSWGPNYLQFGIKLADNFAGENSYDVGMSYTMTDLNDLNAEWRTEINIGETSSFFTEFYQPLDNDLRYFIAPSLKYENRSINLFHDSDLLAKYRVARTILSLEAGRELGTWGELRLGLRQAVGETSLYVGHSPLGNFNFNEGELFARFSFDKLDNVNFPKYGNKLSVEWASLRQELGAEISANKWLFLAVSAHTWDKNTLILALAGATVSNEDHIPIQHHSPLGGFLRLSGYHENELHGNHLLIGQAIYFKELKDLGSTPSYVGFSLEAGNVWDHQDDVSLNTLIPAGSVFFGLDSLLGPLYLGFGYAEGGRRSLYLYLGKSF